MKKDQVVVEKATTHKFGFADSRLAAAIQESIRYEPEVSVEVPVSEWRIPYTCKACRNTRLDDTDKNCWRCGGKDLERV